MMDHGYSWWIMRSVLMMQHEYSWWIMSTHDASLILMILMSTHDASWALMMHHECSWCIMSTHDASWVLMMHHEYSWCIMSTSEILILMPAVVLYDHIPAYSFAQAIQFCWAKQLLKINSDHAVRDCDWLQKVQQIMFFTKRVQDRDLGMKLGPAFSKSPSASFACHGNHRKYNKTHS